MKKYLVILFLLPLPFTGRAQSQELMQLSLNIQKLSQLRKILQNMKDGYTILTNGYNKVKDIAQGNFSLHEVFLEGLWEVNPMVKQYGKVAAIIELQIKLVQEYKAAWQQFKGSDLFDLKELDYIAGVHRKVLAQSLQQLEALAMVISSRELRMSDHERLEAIDRIHASVSEQLGQLRVFHNETKMTGFNRKVNLAELKELRKIY